MATLAAMTVTTYDLDLGGLSGFLFAVGVAAVPVVIAGVMLLIFNRPKKSRE